MNRRQANIHRILTSTAKWTPWNPTTGCTKVSDACLNCYAEATSLFLQRRGIPSYNLGFTPVFHDARINDIASYRHPRRIFVDAMSDLFHDHFTDAQIDSVLDGIYAHPQHIYFILTKRPERMHSMLTSRPQHQNLCIGVTVESETYAWRSEYLCQLQDKFVTFVNCEPLLGPISALPRDGIDICFAAPEAGPHRRPTAQEWFTTLEHYCNANNILYIGHRFDIRSDAGKHPIIP
jgi:protein gp37